MSKSYIWNPATCICESGKYLQSIIDNSLIMCDEITNAVHSESANVISAVSINSDDKKVRCKVDCYILHAVLLVIILLFKIAIISYYYSKDR